MTNRVPLWLNAGVPTMFGTGDTISSTIAPGSGGSGGSNAVGTFGDANATITMTSTLANYYKNTAAATATRTLTLSATGAVTGTIVFFSFILTQSGWVVKDGPSGGTLALVGPSNNTGNTAFGFVFDGTNWQFANGGNPTGSYTSFGDANQTVTPPTGVISTYENTVVNTANRTFTLSGTGMVAGTIVLLTFIDASAFTWTIIDGVSSATIATVTLANNQSSQTWFCAFNGTNWVLISGGYIPSNWYSVFGNASPTPSSVISPLVNTFNNTVAATANRSFTLPTSGAQTGTIAIISVLATSGSFTWTVTGNTGSDSYAVHTGPSSGGWVEFCFDGTHWKQIRGT